MRLEESLLKIYEWHMHYINNQDMQKYSINEIKRFEENIN